MAENKKEEVSRFAAMEPNPNIDPIKQSRGLLSLRSRKMLGSYMRSGGTAVAEKKVSVSVSARDTKLEVIPNPSEQVAVEPSKEEVRKKVVESKKTVRTVLTRRSSSALFGHLKGGEKGEPRNANIRSTPKSVFEEPPPIAPKKKQLLPPKLKLLETFYEGLEAAISLLAIRRQVCTFKSVCKTVEQISKRRFLRSHLAQLKHLFPDVIDIDYVRVPDSDSRRDVWDLRITLKSYSGLCDGSPSPLKGAVSPSRDKNAQTIRRKKEFRSRLLTFASSHAEGVDVPQDALPERPLGGQSISSSPVSEESPISNAVRGISQHVAEESVPSEVLDHMKPPGKAPEADFVVKSTEEVFEFSIVKPRISVRSSIDSVVTSHFSPLFIPHFQQRQQELALLSIKSSDISDLQRPTLSSDTSVHFPVSFERHFSKPRNDAILQEHLSETVLFAADRRKSSHSSSASPLSAHFNSDSGREEGIGVEVEKTSTSGEKGNAEVEEVLEISRGVRSPIRDRSSSGTLESTPADVFSTVPDITYHCPSSSEKSEQYAPSSPSGVHPPSVSSSTPTSLPSTPLVGVGSQSPMVTKTPTALSPSHPHYFVHNSPASGHMDKVDVHHPKSVPVKSTMRSLRFSSPSRPPRPVKNFATQLAPNTPSIGAHLESTPRDQSKHINSPSAPFTPQAATSETFEGASSYFSPEKPQRSRSLRFSTPEKVRADESSVASGSGTTASRPSKSPQSTGAIKAQRFLSPPKAQTLSAPATPAPQTPVRSILYSPPKRAKFNRGSLFPTDVEDERQQVLVPTPTRSSCDADVMLSVQVPSETPALELGSESCKVDIPASAIVCPAAPLKTLSDVSEADLAIIDSLPADLVLSVREKERKIKDENTKELVLQKRRQQMMSGVPKMFNQLRLIFQSLKRSVLPRSELVKNILSTNPDITDRVEVEERLKLLIELAPDWISKQPSANGDFIYRIDKRANMTRIQKKILEAC